MSKNHLQWLLFDIGESEYKRLLRCVDQVSDSFHVITGSPLNCKVLQKLGDCDLYLKLSKPLSDAHPRPMAEIPD